VTWTHDKTQDIAMKKSKIQVFPASSMALFFFIENSKSMASTMLVAFLQSKISTPSISRLTWRAVPKMKTL
jgi:hypothetical protein